MPIMMPKDLNNPTAEEIAERDREMKEHLQIAEADASAAKAFHIAADMEDDIIGLENLVDALRVVALSTACEGHTAVPGALKAIADGMGDCLIQVREAQKDIFHRTWAYACGSRREPVTEAVAS
jgi:hypothetical protein